MWTNLTSNINLHGNITAANAYILTKLQCSEICISLPSIKITFLNYVLLSIKSTHILETEKHFLNTHINYIH
jgi:hypothetical protein